MSILEDLSTFPLSEYIQDRAKGGVTIYKSEKTWVALILMDNGDIRFYKWEKRKGEWKVALARFNILPYYDKLVQTVETLRNMM